MDELFDFNLRQTQERIEAIVDQAYAYRRADPRKSREILEAGLKAYPDNDILLNNLLYVMDYQNDPDEVIRTAGKLVDLTAHEDVKLDALRCMAAAYAEKGDMESAEAAIEQIPEIYFSKLSVAAQLLQGSKQQEAAEKQKWIAFEDTLVMMGTVADCLEAEGDAAGALEEAKRAKALIETMGNDRFSGYGSFDEQIARLSATVN